MLLKSALLGSALICVALLSGCRSQPSREPHLQDGIDWMSWPSARREAFVREFTSGYIFGAQEMCGRAGNLWRREGEPDNPALNKLPSNLGIICQSRIDGFSKFKTSPGRYADVSPYTDPITMYYKNHPEKQYLPVDLLLMALRDSNYDEAARADEQSK